jgi:hypothetical protein
MVKALADSMANAGFHIPQIRHHHFMVIANHLKEQKLLATLVAYHENANSIVRGKPGLLCLTQDYYIFVRHRIFSPDILETFVRDRSKVTHKYTEIGPYPTYERYASDGILTINEYENEKSVKTGQFNFTHYDEKLTPHGRKLVNNFLLLAGQNAVFDEIQSTPILPTMPRPSL